MDLQEVKKEDDLYFVGPFWILANSVKDIYHGNFNLKCEKFLVNYNGDYVNFDISKKGFTSHKKLWDDSSKPYTYYPRGRVRIYDGEAYIHINSRMNTPAVINRIIKEYHIENFDINIEEDDLLQGSHYDFELR